jgi:hypothetical protein
MAVAIHLGVRTMRFKYTLISSSSHTLASSFRASTVQWHVLSQNRRTLLVREEFPHVLPPRLPLWNNAPRPLCNGTVIGWKHSATLTTAKPPVMAAVSCVSTVSPNPSAGSRLDATIVNGRSLNWLKAWFPCPCCCCYCSVSLHVWALRS